MHAAPTAVFATDDRTADAERPFRRTADRRHDHARPVAGAYRAELVVESRSYRGGAPQGDVGHHRSRSDGPVAAKPEAGLRCRWLSLELAAGRSGFVPQSSPSYVLAGLKI